MVAYSFQPRFVDAIRSGRKRQTIRRDRTGRVLHAKPGSPVHIFTGMRTKAVRLIGIAECSRVEPIMLRLERPCQIKIGEGVLIQTAGGLNSFAQCDGFATWQELVDFWDAWHPGFAVFSGTLISWSGFKPAD